MSIVTLRATAIEAAAQEPEEQVKMKRIQRRLPDAKPATLTFTAPTTFFTKAWHVVFT